MLVKQLGLELNLVRAKNNEYVQQIIRSDLNT